MHLLMISSVYASQIAFHNAITRYTLSLSPRTASCPRGRAGSTRGSARRTGRASCRRALAVVVILAFAVGRRRPVHATCCCG